VEVSEVQREYNDSSLNYEFYS